MIYGGFESIIYPIGRVIGAVWRAASPNSQTVGLPSKKSSLLVVSAVGLP